MLEAWIVTFTLILMRVATFCFALPLFGIVAPPRTVKIGLAFALTWFWFASLTEVPVHVVAAVQTDISIVSLGILSIQEVVLGGMLGVLFQLFLIPARVAGSYIAQELGLSLAALSDPTSTDQATVISTLLHLVAILLFFMLNLHHMIILMLQTAFEKIPVASGMPWQSSGIAAAGLAQAVESGIGITGPISIVLFLSLVAILLLARAVPAFNLFSVGISIRFFVGFAAVLVFLPVLIDNIAGTFDSAFKTIEQFFSAT